MATLTYGDVILVSVVSTVGLSLVAFWYSVVMAKHDWTYQVKPKKKAEPAPSSAPAPSPPKP